MALRNRKDIETLELKGVQLGVDESKLKPGNFVRLTNWIPVGINSIQKHRGVRLLSASASPLDPLLTELGVIITTEVGTEITVEF